MFVEAVTNTHPYQPSCEQTLTHSHTCTHIHTHFHWQANQFAAGAQSRSHKVTWRCASNALHERSDVKVDAGSAVTSRSGIVLPHYCSSSSASCWLSLFCSLTAWLSVSLSLRGTLFELSSLSHTRSADFVLLELLPAEATQAAYVYVCVLTFRAMFILQLKETIKKAKMKTNFKNLKCFTHLHVRRRLQRLWRQQPQRRWRIQLRPCPMSITELWPWPWPPNHEFLAYKEAGQKQEERVSKAITTSSACVCAPACVCMSL